MNFKFGINSVVFLVFLGITAAAWIGFELFHQTVDKDFPADFLRQESTPIDASFDETSLNKLYSSRNLYYEVKVSPTSTISN